MSLFKNGTKINFVMKAIEFYTVKIVLSIAIEFDGKYS